MIKWNNDQRWEKNAEAFPTFYLSDPMFDEFAKFVIATDDERDHLIRVDERSNTRLYDDLDQEGTDRDPYYWLKRPLGFKVIAWDFDLLGRATLDDGVYEHPSKEAAE